MAQYKYLTDNGLSLPSVWAWAKRLVQDLNNRDAEMQTAGKIPAGAVQTYAGVTAPVGWLLCDGGLFSKFDYPLLFEAVGYRYGGFGDSFNVPDLRDRFMIGAGGVLALGEVGGAAEITLTKANLPENELEAKNLDSLDTIDPTGDKALPAYIQTDADPDRTIVTGGEAEPFSIIPPAVGINVIIKY